MAWKRIRTITYHENEDIEVKEEETIEICEAEVVEEVLEKSELSIVNQDEEESLIDKSDSLEYCLKAKKVTDRLNFFV
jgi:hypothetical protein